MSVFVRDLIDTGVEGRHYTALGGPSDKNRSFHDTLVNFVKGYLFAHIHLGQVYCSFTLPVRITPPIFFHFTFIYISVLKNSQLMMFSRASCVFEQYVLNGLADSCVLQPH